MMNRIAFNAIVRAARVKPANRSIVPYRWQSSQSANANANTSSQAAQSAQGGQGSGLTAGIAGGLTVLLGGFAWYQFSGTRQVVSTATEASKKAQELKDAMKDKVGDANATIKYLRSATSTLIPGSGPFLGKIFDQVEQISKDHGDEVKKVFEETYNDFEKLSKEGGLDAQTANKAVEILQKRVKEIQELAGDVGGDGFNKLLSDNSELRDKVSKQYKEFTDLVEKAKEKKPEIQKLVKETGTELANLFKDGDFKKNIPKAQDLLKKKLEEGKKLVQDVKK